MKKVGDKGPSNIYWTILELKGIMEDPETCVDFERSKKHVALHPAQLNNINLAVKEIFDADLNTYDDELNGLLLAYKNPKFLSPYGTIINDCYYIHIDLEADFYIFRPKLGSKLKGIVNKVGLNISVLVHRVFNASIPQPEEEEDWPGNNVNVGQEIKFTVDQLDFNSKIPYIRGVLHEDEYLEGCKLYNNEVIENEELIENYETTETSDRKNISFQEDFVADSSGISARKRKRITFDSNSEDEEKARKKAKKKMKIEHYSNSEDEEKRRKKSKKKMKMKIEHDSNYEDEEKERKKSKKKIKMKIEHDSDEVESVVRKIKTEPRDDSSREQSKPVKHKIKKQEVSD